MISLAGHEVSIDEFSLVKEQHSFSIFTPGEPLDVELSVLHLE